VFKISNLKSYNIMSAGTWVLSTKISMYKKKNVRYVYYIGGCFNLNINILVGIKQ